MGAAKSRNFFGSNKCNVSLIDQPLPDLPRRHQIPQPDPAIGVDFVVESPVQDPGSSCVSHSHGHSKQYGQSCSPNGSSSGGSIGHCSTQKSLMRSSFSERESRFTRRRRGNSITLPIGLTPALIIAAQPSHSTGPYRTNLTRRGRSNRDTIELLLVRFEQ